jgi:hypothetical protein
MLEELQTVTNKMLINQPRLIIGCVLRLPDEVREKTPQQIVKLCVGDFLLSFNTIPTIGEMFPYGNQIWQVNHKPIQRPTRYRSHQQKSPLIIFPDWVKSYDNENEALLFILLSSDNK